MKSGYIYPIGTPGQPWNEEERKAWLATQEVKRSYQDEVVSKIDALRERFDVEQYGALSYNEARFPLFCIKTHNWDSTKPVVLVTGGVHGYETSGVHGALKFVETEAERYAEHFNIVVAPCVSPWGYEVINRWNPNAIDPNRSFYKDSPAEESANLIKLVATLGDVLMHIDLHETTDSDETEFRPALAARDGIEYIEGMIPDGFYTVGDSENPQPDFQKAVIESVAKVTHIAPADENGEIIGSPVVQFGVINYPMVKLGLCGGVTNCVYGTTTEVYPDSPTVTDEECNDAQVAAVVGGLNYIIAQL
ncbi:M14 family metallocarboxypeptidase [Vibrio alginolyticus]|uniref:M14 family metallopeptidase n=1 Tax=Vibrio TaxID=662 RepID=UPI001BD62ED3|nr:MULTISPECIES: M14 family metallocarboxypeptidase [Vibrio]EJL6726099.1 M14 family metallocarboxypeptidase [Vibrio alginolyticus]ELA6778387.1 M14 family metallocarboxypeptidase [Vibrio alginolyticus]ELA7328012.1 M14 family metallocarboxypeptidase [Vibrio alginolyticus]ELB2801602.1 M14 family metallocarboxypeptidase [Vibrio alginolyticus]ELC9521026.1 M14 family metallocarboxypeptidase [Vibrio alginolyticus]